jgi:large subunit ribosomal protein L18
MGKLYQRAQRRLKRRGRIRRRIRGAAEQPRLSVFRSARHVYVQAIDDKAGRTLAAASTCEKAIAEQVTGKTGNIKAASAVGKAIGERLLKLGVKLAVFDRGGYRYHGRVKALADGAREAGLHI